jgi:hypothetical protein
MKFNIAAQSQGAIDLQFVSTLNTSIFYNNVGVEKPQIIILIYPEIQIVIQYMKIMYH